MLTRHRFLRASLLILAAVPLVLAGGPAGTTTATIRLIVDYGDGVEKHYNAVPHTDGMTIEAVMESLSRIPPPRGLTYASRGEGERTMLISIDGLAGEGAGKDKRNWLYWVNDKPGDKAFAVLTVSPGDTVAWRFAPYDALQPKK